MGTPGMRLLKQAAADVLALQENVRQAIEPLVRAPFARGVQVKATLSAGANTITHKLGRHPTGWLLLDVSAASAGDMPKRTAWDERTITLDAAAGDTVVLWVF